MEKGAKLDIIANYIEYRCLKRECWIALFEICKVNNN